MMMEPTASWSELRVGEWYRVPGIKAPAKFAGVAMNEVGDGITIRTLMFTDAKGSAMHSYTFTNENYSGSFSPVSSPLRRHGSNAERQAAYRQRVKDRCWVVQEGDHLILYMAGVPTKFKVMSVPECEADLCRGKGHNVRYADIRIERL